MRKPELSQASNVDLVSEFVEICKREKEDLDEEDLVKYGRLLKRQMAIVEELKGRPGDQRQVLVRLYDHEDIVVRLMSSRMTLALEPVRARATLEAIYNAKMPPYSFDAGMTLGMLDEGMFTPT